MMTSLFTTSAVTAVSLWFLLLCQLAMSCTIFTTSVGRHIFVGNNEDYTPGTKSFLWFRPGDAEQIGYVTWGFEEKYPEGGLNEKGLFFDAAALPAPIPIQKKFGRTDFAGYMVEPVLKQCATVAEAVQYMEKFNLVWQEKAQVFLADRTGDYAIVHANYVIRKTDRNSFVLTNYSLHDPQAAMQVCWRRRAAEHALATSKTPTLKLISSILQNTAQADKYNATLYSHAIDLTTGRVTLYQIRNFDQPYTFSLRAELAKGPRNIEMQTLFPPTASALATEKGLDAAIAQIRRTRKINPAELAELGYTLLNDKHPADAIRIFELARDIFPSAKAYSDLANALSYMDQIGSADVWYKKALKTDPNDYCSNLMHSADGVVRFKLHAFIHAEKVGVAGTFNQYKPEALLLTKQGDYWVGEIKLPKGKFFYKVVVDSVWNTDPRNGMAGKPGEWWDSLLIVN